MTTLMVRGSAGLSAKDTDHPEYDRLTGLLNREGFAALLQSRMQTSEKQSVIHLDFEHFGLINQKFGRETGDYILRNTALRLRRLLGNQNSYCRPAGDEFLILINASKKEDLLASAYDIQVVLERPFQIGSQQISLSANIGIARCPLDSDNLELLPDLAECALRLAKSRQEPVAFFSREFHTEMTRTLDVEQALKSAIQKNELEVFLQPKYCFKSGDIVGFEALLRWQDTLLGSVTPQEFVAVAEHSMLGQQLDFYVLRTVSELIAERKDLGLFTPPIAINITTGHFSDPELTGNIFAILEAAGVVPTDIVLEITEGVLMESDGQVAPNLRTLRESGFAIAIDDFGTGYSALSYLKFIPATELKIDKSFMEDIESEQGKALISIIINLAKTYNLAVTAEGIETEAHHTLLQGLGCDYGQGYLLSRPLPAQCALHLLPPSPAPRQLG
ncbi:bifunctional diguanylate cyclase/phosphodiesterase [Marinobacter sp. M-5]|uniref:putative bifunctional diguanylate cyclase/phosphodiesterase n=1 Tax=Marinobacter sp. M-5 TaxID=3081089 RepID=UPI00293CA9F0|nr:bifunctional diguanylate cyclase/phosphodiesterase [Marinobacter sp. M-5]MDV3504323.1 bifunctional diguanylate cyclase/phosphodiesterase [Marinobacter sp. M-5]